MTCHWFEGAAVRTREGEAIQFLWWTCVKELQLNKQRKHLQVSDMRVAFCFQINPNQDSASGWQKFQLSITMQVLFRKAVWFMLSPDGISTNWGVLGLRQFARAANWAFGTFALDDLPRLAKDISATGKQSFMDGFKRSLKIERLPFRKLSSFFLLLQ